MGGGGVKWILRNRIVDHIPSYIASWGHQNRVIQKNGVYISVLNPPPPEKDDSKL